MRSFCLAVCAGILLTSRLAAAAQDSKPVAPQAEKSADGFSKRAPDPDAALQKALAGAANDSSAMVRNLKAYLQEFPEAPRKAAVYRALVEACQQTHDTSCALNYAERFIAVRPGDSQMMLLAVDLLEQYGDEASLARASSYVTRVLDRVEKSPPDDRPARESIAEWQDGQAQLRTALYCVRGEVEDSQRNYDAAARDFQMSYSIHPNALAAKSRAEIAELRGDYAAAIAGYIQAFTLPESGPAGTVDRQDVLRELDNAWRQVHGSEQGLGDAILSAYGHAAPFRDDPQPVTPAQNKDAKDVFSFVVRRLDGTPLPLGSYKGKIVVLSFWATWCAPCRELEPLFDGVARNYAGNPEIAFFAVSADTYEDPVPAFVAREKWDVPVIFANGLDRFLKAETLPAVVVLGRDGEIVYRTGGVPRDGFAPALTEAIQSALSASP